MRNIVLNAPIEKGQFISLKDCGEISFVNGAMGRGVAVKNTSGRIISSSGGRVLTVYLNAIEIISNDGIRLFIQIGDSVFYETSVKENQSIAVYQKWLTSTLIKSLCSPSRTTRNSATLLFNSADKTTR